MSTDLDTYQTNEQTLAAVTTNRPTGGSLIREAALQMHDAYELAKVLCGTGIVPAHFRGKPQEGAAAIMFGASLGLDPINALRGLYNVHGTTSMYARMMAALVLRDGHELWTVSSTDDRVIVQGRRRGSDTIEEGDWDYARAKKAGYTKNDKYQSDPQAMLYAKAVSEVARKIAPDTLNGIYTVEEMEIERGESRPSGPGTGRKPVTLDSLTNTRIVHDAPRAEPEQQRETVDTTTGEVTVTTDEPASRDQLARIGAAFDAVFTESARTNTGKERRASYLRDVLGRDATAGDLTTSEADLVLAALTEDQTSDGDEQ